MGDSWGGGKKREREREGERGRGKRGRGKRGRERERNGVILLASFPVLPRTRFTFMCDNCGGEHFETGKAWSETSREVDVVLYI